MSFDRVDLDGGNIVLYRGDVLDRLRDIPDGSIQCCVTSPPYWGLRDYGVDGQIGLEPTPELFVAKMVDVFREVRRVLRDDGTLWLNLGDSYNAGTSAPQKPSEGTNVGNWNKAGSIGNVRCNCQSLKIKDLCGIPWRVAFALQADGWYLRQDIIWHKPNPMPESVTDRCTKAHEYIFLMSKSARYYYDAEAIREPWTSGRDDMRVKGVRTGVAYLGGGHNNSEPDAEFGDGQRTSGESPTGRNRRSVWTVATQPYKEAHFATFPPKLITPCILAGTSERGCCPECGTPWERTVDKTRTFESGSGRSGNLPSGKNGPGLQGGGETGDIRRGPCVHSTTTGWQPGCDCPATDPVPCTVLDPFNGAGTTGFVCVQNGRNYAGIELNPEYLELARRRIEDELAKRDGRGPLFQELLIEGGTI